VSTEAPTPRKRIFFHPQRFFLDNVPKQADGTCYVLNSEYGELWAEYGEQEKVIARLRAALTISRGQWIHSVNAIQCLEALGEPIPDYVLERQPKGDM